MDREDQIESADEIERLVRERVDPGYSVTGGPVWLAVAPDGLALPDDGWKLHVSSRAATYRALVDAVLPVLLKEGCAFKLARSQRALSELNDGISMPASVGKAVTIYPAPERFRELGLVLAELLRGHEGPRVLSDRRISEASPVYYRFGPFTAKRAFDARGRLDTSVRGPSGEEVDAVATLRYRQPTWTVDPFSGEIGTTAQATQGALVVLGGRYRLIAGIREAAQGNVFRAQDLKSGASVVVKQARALVAEHGDRNDARLRLRNERRVLAVLDGVPGVPRFIDHFRHGPDEFLVTSDCGADNLVGKVRRSGRYHPRPAQGFRGLERLGAQLAGILNAIHRRGVVVRDLSPKNVVVSGATVSIVDFGLAYHDGLHLPGLTPGYAPARQHADAPPCDTDDLHALGLTLLFAASGLHPVHCDDDLDLARVRALQAISAGFGQRPSGVLALVADLLSGDGEVARNAVKELASDHGHPGRGYLDHGPSARWLPAPPVMTPELAAEVTGNLLHDLVGQVHKILRAPPNSQAANDSSLYSGTAGIGLELLRHADRHPAAACLPDLARFTIRIARTALRAGLPQGLFTGVTGVHVFLAQARELGVAAAGDADLSDFMPSCDWTPEGDDLIVGAAGVGLGHLFLHRATGEQAHLRVAASCASQLMDSAVPVSAFTPGGQPSGPGPDRPRIGVDQSAGRAHGLAGVALFLLSHADETADETADAELLAAAAERLRDLAARTRPLLAQARHPAATPMAASWCQGLTGIGQTLLHGSAVLGDPELAWLAGEAADACLELLPRLETLGQCCGAAGLGNFLIDLAIKDDDERRWVAAQDIATHILLRSAGTAGHPDFGTDLGEDDIAGWATGLTGLLAFFRRLANRGGPDCLPAPLGSEPGTMRFKLRLIR